MPLSEVDDLRVHRLLRRLRLYSLRRSSRRRSVLEYPRLCLLKETSALLRLHRIQIIDGLRTSPSFLNTSPSRISISSSSSTTGAGRFLGFTSTGVGARTGAGACTGVGARTGGGAMPFACSVAGYTSYQFHEDIRRIELAYACLGI